MIRVDLWEFGPITIRGELCSKSNSRRIVSIGGKLRSIKSKGALDFVRFFQDTCPKPNEAYAGDVKLTVWAYYKDRRRDLDIALLQDCLQENAKKGIRGIIKNDRQVVEIHAYRAIDKDNPRVIFKLEAA